MESIECLTRAVREVDVAIAAVVDDADMPMTCAIGLACADAEGLYFLIEREGAFYEQLAQAKAMAFTGVCTAKVSQGVRTTGGEAFASSDVRADESPHGLHGVTAAQPLHAADDSCAAGAGASVSVRGRVEELDAASVAALFEERVRAGRGGVPGCIDGAEPLAAFRMYQGSGEWRERIESADEADENLGGPPASSNDLSVAAGVSVQRTEFRFGDDRLNAGVKKRSYFITDDCDGCRACVSKCPEGCIDVSIVPAVIDQNRCTRCGNCEMACFQEAIIVMK